MGEIIFFIVIVVILAFKLYSLFGDQEHSDSDEELREKYSKYIWFFEKDESSSEENSEKCSDEKIVKNCDKEDCNENHTINIVSDDNSQESTEHTIAQKVRLFFNDFNIDRFKKSVTIVYEMLFATLKTGEFKEIKSIVTDDILKQLKSTFSAFEKKGERLVNTDISIEQITVRDVLTEEDDVILVLDIIAKRCCYVQNIADNSIQKGADDKLLTFNEVWKFKKSKYSSDPVWFVSYIDQK